ncbi:retrovirus-related pol polyprotein from transposon TNT 1-94 [Tanacetum coccineum]
MLLCKQAKKGVQLQADQSDWLADMDEEIDEQELEAHYSYMAKIQEIPNADSGTDDKPLEQVQYDTDDNVFANDIQHFDQSESISNTCAVETGDSNVTPNSPDMCDNDIQDDQNDVECDDERVALANLIANLKLDVDENKKIQKQLKKANATLTQELTECKSILAETSRTLGESNSIRDSCLVALQNKQTEFERYKAFNDRTVDYDKLERRLNETLGLLAQKETDIKESLKVKAYEILVVKEKHDELVKQSLLTKSHYEGLVKEKTKVITDLKLKEEKDIDKMISMENQLKFLNEIVYKQSQSIQTIHMLAPKCPTFNGRPTFANPRKLQLKNESVETKFDKPSVVRQPNAQRIPKPSVLGKPAPFSDSLERKKFSKKKSVPKTNESEGLSKPVTTQILPQTATQAARNTNVIKPGMYRIDTRTTQTRAPQLPQTSRNTNPRAYTSTGVIHRTNVSRPQLRSTQMKDKVVPNTSQVKFKKTEVEDHPRISSISNQTKSVTACNDSLNSRTSNVNAVCANCGKCVFNSNHDACVSKYLNDVNARTKKLNVVPISTRKPKSQVNKYVATPHKKIVASESTTQKSKSYYRMLYEKTRHRRLSHLTLSTSNLILKKDVVIGLPKLKYVKDQLCSSCEVSKAKRSSFKTKAIPSSKGRLNLLHIDLCGLMRVASINGKKYILEGIEHQNSTPRIPEHNGIVERQNRTLVEAARTMFLASKLPLFFWAEAIATACYTQNRFIIIPTHEKTAYHIINDRKPSIKHLHIFCCTCYLTRDGENLDKIKEKGDPCILVGYSTQSKGYRVYNKTTRLIVESIHLRFDEIKEMSETSVANDTSGLVPQRQKASDYDNPDPARELQNVSSLADTSVPSQQELDLLFGPLYDEFFNDGTSRVNKSSSPTDDSAKQDTIPSLNIQPPSEASTPTNVHAEENNDHQA